MKELNFNLRAREVADLDPYGVRSQPIKDAASEMIVDEPEILEGLFTPDQEEQLQAFEQAAWENVLGIRPEIAPLPSYFTHEMHKKLNENKFHLVYMPKLDLHQSELRFYKNPSDYLRYMEKEYPKWKNVESLPDPLKNNPNMPKNLSLEFWKAVKAGNISFPFLDGAWLAVENKKKSPLTLKSFGRSHQTFENLENKIIHNQRDVLRELDLLHFRAFIRLPEPIEFNLLANRFQWGEPGKWQWTNAYYGNQQNIRIAMGVYDNDFLGEWRQVGHRFPNSGIGYRAIIDFSRET